MSNNNDWVPRAGQAFHKFADNFCTIVVAHADDWEIPAAVATETTVLRTVYDAAYDAATVPATRTSITVDAAKTARKTMDTHLRHLKRTYIEPGLEADRISLTDYLALGLKPRDTSHSKQPDPTDHVVFTLIVDTRGHIVTASYRIAGRERRGKGRYHGVEVRFWVLPLDAAPVVAADHPGWQSEVDTSSPWKRTFTEAELGKRLYVMMRWENRSAGKAQPAGKGPWSAVTSVVIS
jgi:hypothetical protein